MLNTLSSPQAAQNQQALFESVLLSILLSLFFLDFNLGFFEHFVRGTFSKGAVSAAVEKLRCN